MRNPFEILGLSPKIVKELGEEDLFRLVKACYRALQQAYHPDLREGAKEKALEINLAFEALDLNRNPDSFRKHRANYLKRLSRKTLASKIEELSLKLGRVFREKEVLEENFWESLILNAQEKGHLVSPFPRNLKIQLFDVTTKYNLPFPVFGRNAPFKEFSFDEEGGLEVRYAREQKSKRLKRIILVGCVPRQHLEPWFILEKNPSGEGFLVEGFVKAETFKKTCLPFLKSKLKVDSYLFSFRNEDFSKLYLEGLILRLSRNGKADINVKNETTSLQVCESREDSPF